MFSTFHCCSTTNIDAEQHCYKSLLEDKLRSQFGYKNYKNNLQKEATEAIYRGSKDVYMCMPSGFGKSLCFQLPLLLKENQFAIVISPTISYMKYQVDFLKSKKIIAYSWSSLTPKNMKNIIKNNMICARPNMKLLYITAEQCVTPQFKFKLKEIKPGVLVYIVIDEAHYLSPLSHGFKPEYRKLKQLQEQFPYIPIITVTSTATEKVKDDILTTLNMKDALIFAMPTFRSNLFYEVYFMDILSNPIIHLTEFIGEHLHCSIEKEKRSGIIFCENPATTISLASMLVSMGIAAKAYHSRLKVRKRFEVQNLWNSGDINVIVATSSFGIGISNPSVRFTVHWYVPKSIGNYYQESGRAGHDGKRAHCRIYFSLHDKGSSTQSSQHEMSDSENSLQQNHSKIKIELFAEIKRSLMKVQCRHFLFAKYFDKEVLTCFNYCDVCTNERLFKQKKRELQNLIDEQNSMTNDSSENSQSVTIANSMMSTENYSQNISQQDSQQNSQQESQSQNVKSEVFILENNENVELKLENNFSNSDSNQSPQISQSNESQKHFQRPTEDVKIKLENNCSNSDSNQSPQISQSNESQKDFDWRTEDVKIKLDNNCSNSDSNQSLQISQSNESQKDFDWRTGDVAIKLENNFLNSNSDQSLQMSDFNESQEWPTEDVEMKLENNCSNSDSHQSLQISQSNESQKDFARPTEEAEIQFENNTLINCEAITESQTIEQNNSSDETVQNVEKNYSNNNKQLNNTVPNSEKAYANKTCRKDESVTNSNRSIHDIYLQRMYKKLYERPISVSDSDNLLNTNKSNLENLSTNQESMSKKSQHWDMKDLYLKRIYRGLYKNSVDQATHLPLEHIVVDENSSEKLSIPMNYDRVSISSTTNETFIDQTSTNKTIINDRFSESPRDRLISENLLKKIHKVLYLEKGSDNSSEEKSENKRLDRIAHESLDETYFENYETDSVIFVEEVKRSKRLSETIDLENSENLVKFKKQRSST